MHYIQGGPDVAWVPCRVYRDGVRSRIRGPAHPSTKEAGTEMHSADELLNETGDFRTSWGVERLPPGWYRTEPRRRWSFSSDGDVYDDDDRDSVGSYWELMGS